MSKASNLPRAAWRRVANAAGLAFHSNRIDAVLVSYPKSGRTWFRFILSSYLARGFDLGFDPDLYSMFKVMPNFDMEPVRGLPAFAFARHRPRPPLIAVTHLSYSRLRFRTFPVVFLVRDPRDVMVSSYFHATRHKHRFEGDINDFLKDSRQGVASLTRYLNGWSAGLRHHRHIMVSYEDLSRDPHGETARVLGFLGVEAKPDLVAEAVATASFQSMQKLEQAAGLPGHDYDRSDNESLRMRRGKAGGFADYLTADQIEYIDATCDRELTAEAKAVLGLAVPPDSGRRSRQ